MKLILKHLLRSVCASPLQPMLIMLTVAISMAISVAGAEICVMLQDHADDVIGKDSQLGDVLISTRSDSESRILFAEEIKSIVGNDADVVGEFSLVGFSDATDGNGEKERITVSIAAVDLVSVDRFYKLEYLSYGGFDTENIDNSAVISETFAKAHGLSVGDTVEVDLAGENILYTVEAVAIDSGILLEREMLISFSGFIKTASKNIPALSALGDSFSPCSRVMVKAADGVSEKDVFERLLNDEALADKNIVLTEDQGSAEFWMLVRLIAIYTVLIMIFLLAAFLIGTSLTLLHKKREAEFSRFIIAGASEGQIAAWRSAECGIYAVLGIAAGMALAVPITALAGSVYSWKEQTLTPSLMSLTLGVLMTLALMGICTLRHLRSGRARGDKAPPAKKKMILCGAVSFLADLLVIIFLPVEYKYIPCIIAIPIIVGLSFTAAPELLKYTSRLFGGLIEKREYQPPVFLLALKNAKRRYALSFSCGLLATILSLLAVITVCQDTMSKQATQLAQGISADAMAYGLSGTAEQRMLADGDVDKTLRLYYNTGARIEGTTAIAISAEGDPEGFIDEELIPDAIPQGDQVIISAGLSRLSGADVGDSIDVEIDGVKRTFAVSEVIKVNANLLYFDSDYIGARRNILLISYKDGADGVAVNERLVRIADADGSYLSAAEGIFEVYSENFMGHTSLLRYSMIAAVILGLLGIVNVLIQLYRERRNDSVRLLECGMEHRRISRMYMYEILLMLGSAAVATVFFGSTMCILVDIALHSFGMVLFTF